MKKFLSIIALMAVIYMVAADGLMIHFGLEQLHQYTFNFASIFIIIPACVFGIVETNAEEDSK